MAPARVARTPAAAAAAARSLGFPVALKAVGPAILHKTEVGGVRLGLGDAAEVAREARALKRKLGADLTDFLVQTMVPGGVEVIAGSDPRPDLRAARPLRERRHARRAPGGRRVSTASR